MTITPFMENKVLNIFSLSFFFKAIFFEKTRSTFMGHMATFEGKGAPCDKNENNVF